MNKYHFVSDESKEFFTAENCHILELVHNHSDSKPLSIARTRVAPGATTAWHSLKGVSEYYYILEGSGLMYVGEEVPFEVSPGDIVFIPSDMAQRITNTDLSDDLIFLVICSPPFNDKCYVALE